jgi:hypothetical protein
MDLQKHLSLMGLIVEDKVTGLTGVVSSISFDLYGCIQAAITPKYKEDGSLPNSRWFDVCRLKIINKTPVMDLPDFMTENEKEEMYLKGPAEKPLPERIYESK